MVGRAFTPESTLHGKDVHSPYLAVETLRQYGFHAFAHVSSPENIAKSPRHLRSGRTTSLTYGRLRRVSTKMDLKKALTQCLSDKDAKIP